MIYLRENLEGAYIKNGFNVYKNDPNSKGFKFRLGRFIATFRWSTLVNRWHIQTQLIDKNKPEWLT